MLDTFRSSACAFRRAAKAGAFFSPFSAVKMTRRVPASYPKDRAFRIVLLLSLF